MAFTATANTVIDDSNTNSIDFTPFCVSVDVDDASGCEAIKAGVASTCMAVKKISIICDANITVTIGAGETGGAVTTKILGPIPFTAEGGQVTHEFINPIKIAANTSLTVDASGAGNLGIIVEGYTFAG